MLHKIYNHVLSEYDNTEDKLVMQINIGLAQLKKQWLKSGNFDPREKSNESFCDWMINLLGIKSNLK